MKHVWIVDDEPDFRELTARILEREGYEVTEVKDGFECLELLEKNEYPDLILLDVMMPELDGWEVCRRIKADPALNMIPICIISAKTTLGDIQHSLNKAHANWHLNKPVERSKLLEAVRWFLEQSL